MRKRFLPFFVCALAAMLAVSCDPHHFPEDSGEGFSLTLHFNFDLPVHRIIEAQTKAKAKADPQPRARYTVQLHRYVDEYPYTEAPQYIFSFTRDEIEDLDTTIFLPIAPDRYKVLAWTDYVDGHGLPYWDATDFNEITLISDYAAGKYARDAFRGSSSLDLSGLLAAGMYRDLTVEMTRPVARLRVIIPDGLAYLSSKGVSAASLTGTLSWTSPLPSRYDLFSDRATGSLQDASVSSTAFLDDEGALVFCIDHVLTGTDGLAPGATFSFGVAGGETLGTWSGEIPLLRGHLTTLILRPVTPDPIDPDLDHKDGVGIDPVFDSETEITF